MLSAATPSRSTSATAAARIRSRDSDTGGSGCALPICMPYCTLYTRRGRRTGVPSRSTTRLLVWGALAGQVAFVVAWIVGGALEPHYSAIDEYVSELGARDAAHAWIVNAGIVVLGLSWGALAIAL